MVGGEWANGWFNRSDAHKPPPATHESRPAIHFRSEPFRSEIRLTGGWLARVWRRSGSRERTWLVAAHPSLANYDPPPNPISNVYGWGSVR